MYPALFCFCKVSDNLSNCNIQFADIVRNFIKEIQLGKISLIPSCIPKKVLLLYPDLQEGIQSPLHLYIIERDNKNKIPIFN